MDTENTTHQKSTRTPRENQTRAANARRAPWKPPSMLDAPPMGFDDRKNVSARSREGWEMVRGEEYPDFDIPTVEDGKHAGVIGVGGLLLARVPVEIVEERNDYYRSMTHNQMAAVDNDLAREQHPAMPISKPDRQTRVTFGGPQGEGQES